MLNQKQTMYFWTLFARKWMISFWRLGEYHVALLLWCLKQFLTSWQCWEMSIISDLRFLGFIASFPSSFSRRAIPCCEQYRMHSIKATKYFLFQQMTLVPNWPSCLHSLWYSFQAIMDSVWILPVELFVSIPFLPKSCF